MLHIMDEYMHRKKTGRQCTKISTMVILAVRIRGGFCFPYIIRTLQIFCRLTIFYNQKKKFKNTVTIKLEWYLMTNLYLIFRVGEG